MAAPYEWPLHLAEVAQRAEAAALRFDDAVADARQQIRRAEDLLRRLDQARLEDPTRRRPRVSG